ncbi:MAG TPA: hypothetical protein VNW97_02355 [Candidatus Saccharimonadales bacterium]|jgi:hypothetical protein|nr:hypothetical protein [Candidatus Saccharimonadales bacterium]
MDHKYRYLSSIFLTAALAAPVAMMAIASPRDDDRHEHHRRYYDRQHKDYHTWDSNEDHAYRRYQTEHREQRPFVKLNRRQKTVYWGWRHENPDNR